jgi:AraC family transcriptional regulator
MSLTSSRLFDGEVVSVRHVRCRPAVKGAGAIEHAEVDTLVLPGRGAFFKHLSRTEAVVAEPTQALLFARGRPYRVSHPDLAGDDCLALQFAPGALREALAAVASVDRLDASAVRPGVTLAPAAIGARALLSRRLSAGDAEGLEVEETGLALLGSVIASAAAVSRPARTRLATRVQRRQQADGVRARLRAEPARRWTLAELARGVYTTPFHLARLFRHETGTSVHQYQLRVRLAAALDPLLETDRGVSEIALGLGFATHSHFTAAFRTLLGVAPERFRRTARGGDVRELRTILVERLRTRA